MLFDGFTMGFSQRRNGRSRIGFAGGLQSRLHSLARVFAAGHDRISRINLEVKVGSCLK